MIDFKLKYQAVIFVINEDITPNAKIIQRLMTEVFFEYDLVPNTFYEMTNLIPQPVPRIRFSSTNNEWSISFGSGRIDIEKMATGERGENLGELKVFCETASRMMEKLFKAFPKKANRLSLVTDCFFKSLSVDELHNVYTKLFSPSKTFKANKPFEWNFRSAVNLEKDFTSKKEGINFIGSLNRINGAMVSIGNFKTVNLNDRIQLVTDINTSQINNDFRFDIVDIKNFYSRAFTWTEEFQNEIIEHLK